MSRIKEFVEELQSIHNGNAWHGPSLREALAGITATQAAACPIPNAHTIWELVGHITAWEDVWRRRIEGTQVSEPEEGDFPPPPAPTAEAWNQTLARLDRVHQEFLRAIETLPEIGLKRTVPGKPYTIQFMLQGAVRHHVYHSGQIALLKKSLDSNNQKE
jgi:uncharacterized damage-inducible protein DinB